MNNTAIKEKILKISRKILENKQLGVGHCKRCPLQKNPKNLPELGALAGHNKWTLGLDLNKNSVKAIVILTPSGRHYTTGSPQIPNKKWSEIVEKINESILKGDIVSASKALPLAFEIRISSPISWPKGGWFYSFLDNLGKKQRISIYFTRIVKCGVRELRETELSKAQELCPKYILDEIWIIQPKIIITIGNDSFQFFKDLIKEKAAFLIDAYSSIYNRRVSKTFSIEEGLVKIHSNGYRFKIKIKNIDDVWLIPLLHPEFFLTYFDSFVKIIKILSNFEFPEFPLGDYLDDVKHVLKMGPSAVYLYPLWANIKQLLEEK